MPTNDKKPEKAVTPVQSDTSKETEPAAQAAASDAPVGATKAASGAAAAPENKPIGGLIAVYTLGRMIVFAVLVVIFYLVGLRGLPGMIAGAIVSIPVSYFLLAKTRVEVANRIAARKESELSRKDAFRTAGK